MRDKIGGPCYESLSIEALITNENLAGFIEGYKREKLTLKEYKEFLEFALPRVDEEILVRHINETLIWLEANDVAGQEIEDDMQAIDWLNIVEEFYTETNYNKNEN